MNYDLSAYNYRLPVALRWSDMDEMHHVNNAVYATYFEDARGRFLMERCQWDWNKDGIILARITIEFKAAVRVEDNCFVHVRRGEIGNKSFQMEYLMTRMSQGVEQVVAACESVQVMYDYHQQRSILIPEHLRTLLEKA